MLEECRIQLLKQLGWSKIGVTKDGNTFEIAGYYIPPMSGSTKLSLKCDGLNLSEERHTIEKNMALGDYNCDVYHVYAKGTAIESIKLINIHTVFNTGARANSIYHDWFWIQNPLRPLPPLELMKYIGADDSDWFHFAGGSWAEKSLRLWETLTNRDRSSLEQIIDWGCGCARVSRHYFDLCDAKVIGLDVDEKVINWCQNNLPNGEWHTIDLSPPCNIPDNSADLIVGHSVFTHLGEVEQFQWLNELARLVKPGGLVMVTILGAYAPLLEPISANEEEYLKEHGFIHPTDKKKESDKNPIFVKTGGGYPSYHKGVFHTHDYINTKWSEFFNVLGIIEGFADHQALVILQKPL